MDARPRPIDAPEPEVPPDGAPGRKSCGRWRHGHPVLIRYRIALTISRISTVRCLPPCFSSGIRGSSMRHCSSVRSDGYCLRQLNQTSLHVPQCYQTSYRDREVRLHGKLSIHPLRISSMESEICLSFAASCNQYSARASAWVICTILTGVARPAFILAG